MRCYKNESARPESLKNVPEMRIRESDLMELFKLYASWDAIEKICDDETFAKRVRTIPGGWRDLRMLRSKLENLVNALMWTIPGEKIEGVARTVKRMRYSVTQGPIASRPTDNREQVVNAWEIDALVSAAHKNKCRLCDGANCGQCKLGKALDNLVAYDREGGSWSLIDIEVDDK